MKEFEMAPPVKKEVYIPKPDPVEMKPIKLQRQLFDYSNDNYSDFFSKYSLELGHQIACQIDLLLHQNSLLYRETLTNNSKLNKWSKISKLIRRGKQTSTK